MGRTFVIGDIHGSYKAVKSLLAKIAVQKEDKLIFLGDFVDGWSQSFEVIELMRELEKTNECIFIKGNHDVWCEDWLRTGNVEEMWYNSGGKATMESYAGRTDAEIREHLDFYARLHNYYVDEQNRLFIHAGFASVRGPENERYASNYNWDRTLWEVALSLDDRIQPDSLFYPKRLKLFKEIYIGHTPTIYIGKYEPVNAANLWNMDTGAAFDGKLSALDVDTKQFWQSETVMELYPDEQGRN